MSMRGAGVLAAVLWAAVVGPAAAQGLADVARKEAERRDAITTPGKVLTNADLPASAIVTPSPGASADDAAASEAAATGARSGEGAPAGASAASSAPAGTASTAAPTDDEQGWTQRARAINGALADARAQVRQLQALVDRLGLEMAATDAAIAARAAAERADVRNQLALAREKEALAATARGILEQEARASGVPASWIQ